MVTIVCFEDICRSFLIFSVLGNFYINLIWCLMSLENGQCVLSVCIFLISSLLNFNLPFFLCHLSGPVNCYPSISLVLCCYPSIISDLTWIVLSVAILLSYLISLGLSCHLLSYLISVYGPVVILLSYLTWMVLLSFFLSHLDGPVSYLSILSQLGGPVCCYHIWLVLSVTLLSHLGGPDSCYPISP